MGSTNGLGGASGRLAHSPNGGAPVVPGNPGNSGGKKGRSGRRPDWLKQRMAVARETCVDNIARKAEAGELDADQEIKVVEKFAPPEEQAAGSNTLIVVWQKE